MKAIVTFSLGPAYQRKQHHNPLNKKTGECPVSGTICTDITGAHHSMLFAGESMEEIEISAKGFACDSDCHITRIEVIEK
jgi:hypothetical protein